MTQAFVASHLGVSSNAQAKMKRDWKTEQKLKVVSNRVEPARQVQLMFSKAMRA